MFILDFKFINMSLNSYANESFKVKVTMVDTILDLNPMTI